MKSTIRLAYLSDAIYPYNKGGKEKRIFDISTQLASQGYQVDIYTMKWWPENTSKKTENGVNLHAISRLIPLYSNGRRSIIEALWFGLSCFKLWNKNFDIIEVDHMPYFPALITGLICFIQKKHMILTWLEVWDKKYWKSYLGALGTIGAWFENITINLPFPILSISRHTTEKIKSTYKITNRVSTIPIGIDIQKINSIPASIKKYDVIFSGRLLKHKHIDYLINAVEVAKNKHPHISCLIIGVGPTKNDLIDLTKQKKLGGNITFNEFYENDIDLFSQIKSSKVFVLPSTREGFSISTIEANACGVPVIAIDHPDNAAKDLILTGKNGYICKLDSNEIAKFILKIIKEKSLSQHCKQIAKKYNWPYILTDLKKLYES